MKIAYLIAFRNFRDEEYFIPKRIFEDSGHKVKTFSSKKGEAIGSEGGSTKTENLVELDPKEFDAIVIAGGQGAPKHLDNEEIYSLVNEFYDRKKLVAAICISPTILAKAGLLQDRKATVWSSSLDKSAVKTLEKHGANYVSESVVCDGKIITGNGPQAAKNFAKRVVENL